MTSILSKKHTQPDGSNPYEYWREEPLGIGHGKNWGVKFSPPWPVEYHGISTAVMRKSSTTASRSVSFPADCSAEDDAAAKACGFWNAGMEEVADEEAEKQKRRELIALLQQKHPNSGASDSSFGLLALLKK
jgi:hypothetical protein